MPCRRYDDIQRSSISKRHGQSLHATKYPHTKLIITEGQRSIEVKGQKGRKAQGHMEAYMQKAKGNLTTLIKAWQFPATIRIGLDFG
jgi:hypothetical protein